MIVNHEYRFIFLKTYKTAGTSLEIALSKHCSDDDIVTRIQEEDYRQSLGARAGFDPIIQKAGRNIQVSNHCSAEIAKRIVGAQNWQRYTKFTIERNPFDKCLSHYWYFLSEKRTSLSLSDWLYKASIYYPELITNWPLYTIRGKIAVDHFLFFENLPDDFTRVEDILELKLDIPAYRVKSEHKPDQKEFRDYRKMLSDSDRKLIERVCRKEIDYFDYTF